MCALGYIYIYILEYHSTCERIGGNGAHTRSIQREDSSDAARGVSSVTLRHSRSSTYPLPSLSMLSKTFRKQRQGTNVECSVFRGYEMESVAGWRVL